MPQVFLLGPEDAAAVVIPTDKYSVIAILRSSVEL